MRGPIDYIVVKFEGAKFEGKILEELAKAVEAGSIAVLALNAIVVDGNGNVNALDISGETATFATLDNSLIDQDDIDEVSELLEPNTGAGLLIVEQLWAKGLKQAIIETGGSLVAEGRIHPEAALELEEV